MAQNKPILNILLIDPEEEDFLLLNTLLNEIQGENYSLHFYTESVPPIKLICSGLYDVVFTKSQIGSMRGIEILQAVKQGCPQVPVIMLTDWNLPDLEQTALASGASAFLRKTELNREILETTLQKVLGSL